MFYYKYISYEEAVKLNPSSNKEFFDNLGNNQEGLILKSSVNLDEKIIENRNNKTMSFISLDVHKISTSVRGYFKGYNGHINNPCYFLTRYNKEKLKLRDILEENSDE